MIWFKSRSLNWFPCYINPPLKQPLFEKSDCRRDLFPDWPSVELSGLHQDTPFARELCVHSRHTALLLFKENDLCYLTWAVHALWKPVWPFNLGWTMYRGFFLFFSERALGLSCLVWLGFCDIWHTWTFRTPDFCACGTCLI